MATSNSIRRAQPLLGTFVEIAGPGAAGCDLQAALDAAFAAVAQVHGLMSFHDPDSDVSRLNREASGGAVPVHPWTYRVLQTAIELNRRSAGLFDITVAPLLQKRGLLPRRAHDPDTTAKRTTTADVIELLADGRVRFSDPGVLIDLGGIAKGFAVDCAVAVLQRHRLSSGLVNAGGDLAVFGPQLELVHIRNPLSASRLLCRAEIANAALASSGRMFDPFESAGAGDCAVFDPNTQNPVRGIVSATVRASCCMIADALTKVVMIAGERATGLLTQYCASALFVLESGDVWITPDWQSAVRLAA